MTACKICKSESITQLIDNSCKGSVLPIPMEYSVCNECGREFVSRQQLLNNDSCVRDAKKSDDGLEQFYWDNPEAIPDSKS